MSYQFYRTSTLGTTLQETINEMTQEGLLSPDLVHTILKKFDKSISKALNKQVKARVTFKADKLLNYRHCDNVWTLLLKNVEFREGSNVVEIMDTVKIVACISQTD
ncbi:transcription initiation factor IIA subunit 2 [Drosophila elegans]|uniref:transcription initiation factor IIA subunit 2 n=1 Tax=Drosophila elegans TaxID=30023 RepID=UPI0007E6D5B4|nr:transcription initiation factor IIA subunit 2 [Drosophila elegans]